MYATNHNERTHTHTQKYTHKKPPVLALMRGYPCFRFAGHAVCYSECYSECVCVCVCVSNVWVSAGLIVSCTQVRDAAHERKRASAEDLLTALERPNHITRAHTQCSCCLPACIYLPLVYLIVPACPFSYRYSVFLYPSLSPSSGLFACLCVSASVTVFWISFFSILSV